MYDRILTLLGPTLLSGLLVLGVAGCHDPNKRTDTKDADGDGFDANEDCDDANADVHPGAEEICDDIDNDCDDAVDGHDDDVVGEITWYRDADGDGYGITGDTEQQCSQPEGYADNPDDCDDTSRDINPGVVWFFDGDGDGYGVSTDTTTGCYLPDGYAAEAGDCDDGDETVSPDATEICDGLDNDCDNDVDSDDPSVADITWYQDADADGYGNDDRTKHSCDVQEGYVEAGGDCDEDRADVNPGATEYCDGIDNDCDSLVDGHDDSIADSGTWYADLDGDGYGDALDESRRACDQPDGEVDNNLDCDDTDATINPDGAEVCDEVDNDCDTLVDDADDSLTDGWLYEDTDGDGYGGATAASTQSCTVTEGYSATSDDCDDGDYDTNPGAVEILDGYDSDCDGTIDNIALSAASDRVIGERAGDSAGSTVSSAGDIDGDGYGDLVIGAPGEDSGGTGAGAAYVLLGPVSGTVDLSLARAKVIGDDIGDGLGESIAAGEDLDGDGLPDLAFGAPDAYGLGDNGGAVYVVSGADTGPEAASDARLILYGESSSDAAGQATAFAGDLDADGVSELLVGAWGEDSGGGQAGVVYVVDGTWTGANDLSLADKLIGESAGDYAGYALAGGSDVDGDGVDDMLIGAYGEDSGGSEAGAVYFVSGMPSAPLDLAYADAKLQGEAAGDDAGKALGFGGDLDGDGTIDLIIGAPGDDTDAADGGAVYMVSGYGLASLDLATVSTVWTGVNASDAAGSALCAAGDVNVDGFDDLIVGVPGYGSAGEAALVLGPIDGGGTLDSADATFLGEVGNDAAGTAVAGAGDTDGDGIADLAVGVPGQDDGGSAAGAVMILLGAGF